MKILKNQKSKNYPKNDIMSYKVIIIQENTIKEIDGGYQYDAYYFNSLNEYNNWEKNKKIIELENNNNELENRLSSLEVVPDLPSRTEKNADNINTINSTIDDLTNMVVEVTMQAESYNK